MKVTRCEFVHNLPCEQVSGRLTELEAENAKLRELVAQRTAKRVVVSNSDTDHATGHAACGACGGAIDTWDKWCRHCGARMEDE